MAHSHKQNGRPLRLGQAGARTTNIDVGDLRRFKLELMSRPDRVLRRFKKCAGFTLMDLPTYLEILVENRERAIVIARVTAAMKIPIGDESIDIDEALRTMKPGEV